MKEIQYKSFSLKTHKKNWQMNKANSCDFELTFKCGLHCRHCYTDCYNKPFYQKKELNTQDAKFILDKIHSTGIIWLCFTGGDPLERGDFLDIYSYAKRKGFIISIFTNGYSMTKKTAERLKDNPPFVIEITLNAVTEKLYEKISQVKGSFKKTMDGIELIFKKGLPLEIKTQITKDNLQEISGIKTFIKTLGLQFQPDFDVHARLNGDSAPLSLKVTPQDILYLTGKRRPSGCYFPRLKNDLFRCNIGSGGSFYVGPDGNMFLCNLLRKPNFNLLEVDIEYALNELLSSVRNEKFITDSKCNGCNLTEFCIKCPGIAHLETGDKEASVEYYCELAKVTQNGNT